MCLFLCVVSENCDLVYVCVCVWDYRILHKTKKTLKQTHLNLHSIVFFVRYTFTCPYTIQHLAFSFQLLQYYLYNLYSYFAYALSLI